jgi:hypothetical protein
LNTVNRFRNGIALSPLRRAPPAGAPHRAQNDRIDDGGVVLALADVAAEPQRLAERHPILGAEAVLDHRTPEDQYVDSRILAAGRRILRHGERRLRCYGPPRLNPGHTAGLQLGDDLVGDFLMEARPVSTGASASG